jgi:hypothetical protein
VRAHCVAALGGGWRGTVAERRPCRALQTYQRYVQDFYLQQEADAIAAGLPPPPHPGRGGPRAGVRSWIDLSNLKGAGTARRRASPALGGADGSMGARAGAGAGADGGTQG